jgi:aerobic-type carbon monoxide dehydrogenase small subunit (CoxS/CutS family)
MLAKCISKNIFSNRKPTMQIIINAAKRSVPDAQKDDPLVWVLHDTLQMNGTRYGCGMGLCGCCTVLIDNKPSRACQIKAIDVGGRAVVTIEGLANGDKLHPVQQAFLENPLQCCYCMSGHMLTAVALLEANRNPTDADIEEAMAINLCRCGGYNNIRANVKRAGEIMRGHA